MSAALELDGVRVTLRGRPVLHGLTTAIADGECRALVGLNGAGKTTALRVILGMLRPDSGSVRLLGDDIATAPRRIWGRVGHLIETPFSYPELTARQNIDAAVRLHGGDSDRARSETERMSEALGLSDWLDTPVRRMSLGTRQKVGIISALVHEPRVVVLDEPTNGLDPIAVVGFRDLLDELTDRGGAVLVTSHHFDELARVADQVDILHRGRIIETIVPDGSDLERAFFATILAADRADRPEQEFR